MPDRTAVALSGLGAGRPCVLMPCLGHAVDFGDAGVAVRCCWGAAANNQLSIVVGVRKRQTADQVSPSWTGHFCHLGNRLMASRENDGK